MRSRAMSHPLRTLPVAPRGHGGAAYPATRPDHLVRCEIGWLKCAADRLAEEPGTSSKNGSSSSRSVRVANMIETAPAALTLVVPVYNERRRFDRFASDLAEFTAHQPAGSELVFVDDGSTDGTVELIEMFLRRAALRGHCVRLLRCAHMGKGAAVRAGLETAVTPLAGFCDLDLSTPLADFLHLVDASADAPILTIASRGLAASRLTRRQGHAREFLGRTFNKAVQLALIPGVVDTQCGAKVARTELWRAILPFSRENGFAWDVEIIADRDAPRYFGAGSRSGMAARRRVEDAGSA